MNTLVKRLRMLVVILGLLLPIWLTSVWPVGSKADAGDPPDSQGAGQGTQLTPAQAAALVAALLGGWV